MDMEFLQSYEFMQDTRTELLLHAAWKFD